ncbi:unnamed protein product [Adineta steineri]|uniref:Uncharacterized protein n=1 Tax=Adineta steineri TaxID=433720 RepID=A0A814XU44_9BILA|nr:unnamed protein product [Adineta steineri]CAF3770194.1 unnamed protein product [Adineta steineri]
MGLQRSSIPSIFYNYRRISSITRNRRYQLHILITIITYVIIYIHIQVKLIPTNRNSISCKNYSQNLVLNIKEKNESFQILPSVKIYTEQKIILNQSNVINISQETRLRYSFIDIDALNVNTNFLDEIYQPSTNFNIKFPSSNSHSYSRLLNIKGNSSTIIYNRIPQCYEFTMGSLLKHVSYLHSFTYIPSQIYTPFSYNQTSLISIARSLTNHKYNRLLYERHIYFFDFSNLTFSEHPVWINLVRDPIYRIALDFNNSREICRLTNRCFVNNNTINDTLDQCVLKYSPHVCISQENGVSKMILFFCGLTHSIKCQDDSTFALKQAKQNIDFFYTVIGIAEEFYSFLYVLEKLFPQYFKHARLIYMNTRDSHQLADNRDVNIQLPNKMTIKLLEPYLKDEYELYNYIKRRFLDQYRILTEMDN